MLEFALRRDGRVMDPLNGNGWGLFEDGIQH
jgi:hypothetical protein